MHILGIDVVYEVSFDSTESHKHHTTIQRVHVCQEHSLLISAIEVNSQDLEQVRFSRLIHDGCHHALLNLLRVAIHEPEYVCRGYHPHLTSDAGGW